MFLLHNCLRPLAAEYDFDDETARIRLLSYQQMQRHTAGGRQHKAFETGVLSHEAVMQDWNGVDDPGDIDW